MMIVSYFKHYMQRL